jgi:putative phosphoribosyl transferase
MAADGGRDPQGERPPARAVAIAAGGVTLAGDLTLGAAPRGVVLFAHGSGSSRFSPRNRFVAGALVRAGLGTLLVDLLTAEEEASERATGHLRFDIALLTDRLVAVTDWLLDAVLAGFPRARPIGYFGASTGAAAALAAAARRPSAVGAIVSRGGRPDLALEALRLVTAPTLLIVGGNDAAVLALNRQAFAVLPGEKALRVVPGASHLFEEPGALEEVAALAARWFLQYLPAASRGPAAPP